MDLLLPWSAAPLARWIGRPYSPAAFRGPAAGDRRAEASREAAVEPPGEPVEDGPHRAVLRAILRFDVHPPALARAFPEREPLRVGDVVGLRYRLAPGLDAFFAARVTDVFDRAEEGVRRSGMTYRTLDGHPLEGEETFSVVKDLESGRVRIEIRSWSRLAFRTLRPGPLRRWTESRQAEATDAMLAHLAGIAAAARVPVGAEPGRS